MTAYELGILAAQRANVPGHLKQADAQGFAGVMEKRAGLFSRKPEPAMQPIDPPATDEEWLNYARQAYESGKIEKPTVQSAKAHWAYRKKIADLLGASPLFSEVTRYN
jgi:hypothetical protein